MPLILILLMVVLVPVDTVKVNVELGGVRKLVKVASRTDLQVPFTGVVVVALAGVLHQRIGAAKVCVAVGVAELIQVVNAAVVQYSPATIEK